MRKYVAALHSEFISPSISVIRGLSWDHPFEIVTKIYHHFMTDSLYRNSIYLMLSTAVQALFGFIFWTINARIFSPDKVGLATTLLSIGALISNFCLLGFNSGLVRYLPKAGDKNKKINSVFILAVFSTILASIIYLSGIKFFTPKLSFLTSNILFEFSFVIFLVFFTLNVISDNIFIAFRATNFVFIKNTLISILKVILPILFISLGAYGIFTSVYLSTTIAFFIGVAILISKFEYLIKLSIDWKNILKMAKLSFGNFISNYVGGLPSMLLPILITNKISTKASAVFYIDMMIANLLFIIPIAATQSLFAEGSFNESEVRQHLKKTLSIIMIILIPAVVLVASLGNIILHVFGNTYSVEGIQLLRLLAISGLFSSIGYITNALLNIYHESRTLIFTNAISTLLLLGFTSLLLSKGLFGIGVGFLIGQILISVIQTLVILRLLKIR